MNKSNEFFLTWKQSLFIGFVLLSFFGGLFLVPSSKSRHVALISRENSFPTTTTSTSSSYITVTSTWSSTVSNVNINSPVVPMNSTMTLTTRSLDEILCDNLSDHRSVDRTQHPCEKIRCAVILSRSGGRLGNRMFIFATAYGLARTHHCRLYVSERIQQELYDNFRMATINSTNMASDAAAIGLTDKVIMSNICNFIPSLFRPKGFKNIELIGYWQSYLYFDAFRDDIRRIFSPRSDTVDHLANYFTDLLKVECSACPPLPNRNDVELRQAFRTVYNITWIGVHIRRTDFRGIGYDSNESYLFVAMLHYRKRYYFNDVRFIVTSDDKAYCARLFDGEIKNRKVFVMPFTFSRADDLFALTLTHHSIATGGTYSFWAAYLTGGEVIHDIRYKIECRPTDYFPPWFLLIGPAQLKRKTKR